MIVKKVNGTNRLIGRSGLMNNTQQQSNGGLYCLLLHDFNKSSLLLIFGLMAIVSSRFR